MASSVEAWLRANGFDDLFVDHTAIRSGDKWTEALRRAKGSCRVVLCLVTPEWLASDECYGEFTAGWYAGRRIIPLIAIAGATLDDKQKARFNRVLGEDQGADISRAGAPDALNLDATPVVGEPLKAGLRAAGALAKIGLDPHAFEIDRNQRPEPFPGLESFGDTDGDAALFFGRSPEIAQCLEDLREMRATGDRRLYAILGASGSGKSSLMKAGLLPRLRRERGWFVTRSFRAGADPLLNLSDAIARTAALYGEARSPGATRDALLEAHRHAEDLRRAVDSIISPLKARADRQSATTLIAIDQGEELARADGESADALAAILRALLAPVSEGDPSAYTVMITVRSDSFPELQVAPRFQGLNARTADIRTLPVYRFDNAIEQPAARYGVEIESDLVEALMEDAGGKDALPLLAFTLQRLWRQYEAEKRIRKVNYDSIGKLSGLIEDAAERALRGGDPTAQQGPLQGRLSNLVERRAARAFVPGLAQVDEHGVATRRVARLSSFDDDERDLLAHFDKWHLIVKNGDAVEVAHEAMFREWPRFQHWLKPEKERLEALRSVEVAALEWDAHARRAEYLIHNGPRLALALGLSQIPDYRKQIDAGPATRDYLAACRRIRGFRRVRAAALAAIAVGGTATLIGSNLQLISGFMGTVAHAEAALPGADILTSSLREELSVRRDILDATLSGARAASLGIGSAADETVNTWTMAEIFATLAPQTAPSEQFDTYFARAFVPDCGCWGDYGSQNIAATAWTVMAHTAHRRPLPEGALDKVLALQTPGGAWGMFYDAPNRDERASTYATALMLLALHNLADADLVDSFARERIDQAVGRARNWLQRSAPAAGQWWEDYPQARAPTPSRGLSATVVYVLLATGGSEADEVLFHRWFQVLRDPTPIGQTDGSDQFVVLLDGSTRNDNTTYIVLAWELAAIRRGQALLDPLGRIRARRFVGDAMRTWSRTDTGRFTYIAAESSFALGAILGEGSP